MGHCGAHTMGYGTCRVLGEGSPRLGGVSLFLAVPSIPSHTTDRMDLRTPRAYLVGASPAAPRVRPCRSVGWSIFLSPRPLISDSTVGVFVRLVEVVAGWIRIGGIRPYSGDGRGVFLPLASAVGAIGRFSRSLTAASQIIRLLGRVGVAYQSSLYFGPGLGLSPAPLGYSRWCRRASHLVPGGPARFAVARGRPWPYLRVFSPSGGGRFGGIGFLVYAAAAEAMEVGSGDRRVLSRADVGTGVGRAPRQTPPPRVWARYPITPACCFPLLAPGARVQRSSPGLVPRSRVVGRSRVWHILVGDRGGWYDS